MIMKFLLAFSLTLGLPMIADGQTTEFNNLKSALLGDTEIEEDLQYLCDVISGRVTGSDANKKSVEWLYSEAASMGLMVEKMTFEMPVLWLPGSTKASILEYPEIQLQAVSKYQSPPGVFESEVVIVEEVTEDLLDSPDTEVKGKWILVPSDLCLDIGGLFAEYEFAERVERYALNNDALGILFMSSRPQKLLYRFISSKSTANSMPQIIVAREDAQRMIRLLQNQSKISVRVEIVAQTGPSFISENIIIDIPGSINPEEIVLVGAHIDSWALGTGANDNGCNVVMLLDIARQMQSLGLKPNRTIRFAFWNGEEQGYFGSWAYTKDKEAELANHLVAMSIDIGSGAISGFFTNGRPELKALMDTILKPITALGPYTNLDIPIVGTDNFDFMLQGVPNLVGNHLSASYGLNYHASSDTYDKVDFHSLKRNSVIVAEVLWAFANGTSGQYKLPRQSRRDIQAMFDQNKLEYTMRMFNVWEPWITGQRGMK